MRSRRIEVMPGHRRGSRCPRPGRRRSFAGTLLAAALLLLAGGCATNPVTGKSELSLVSEAQERSIGEQQYRPTRQMEGGEYVVDPELVDYVRGVGERLARVSDRPLDYEFTVLNNGTPNAWALPGGKIAINRGLLYELDNEAQLAAVLGHEIVHAAARHGARSMERGMLLQGALLATMVAVSDSDYAPYAVAGAQVGAALIQQKYGRGAELESDRYGMIYMDRAGYDPQGAVELQETFVRLSEGRRSDWLSGLFASHPPSRERVEANRRTAAELGPGGERGEEAYRRATRRLEASRPAYEAYAEGREALAEGRLDAAAAAARRAIGRVPEEAQFYGLLGDVALSRRDYRKALAEYDRAIQRNPEFFRFYLGRGEAHRRLGNRGAAEADLRASTRLLPTADGMAALGQLAEQDGRPGDAIALYREAAASATPAGRLASQRLLSLDLPRDPDRYLPVAVRVDQSGRVYLEVGNRSRVPVRDVTVLFAWRDAYGQVRREQRRLPGPVAPGQAGVLMLGTAYAPFLETLQARTESARVAGG